MYKVSGILDYGLFMLPGGKLGNEYHVPLYLGNDKLSEIFSHFIFSGGGKLGNVYCVPRFTGIN